jgi:uncharacterized protein YbaP (TraB family)
MRPIVVLFLVLGVFGAGAADASECSGRSLLKEIQRERPEVWEPALAAFEAIPNGTGLFWKIEREGVAPSWLLGTMHMPDPAFEAMQTGFADEFAAADLLALELIDDQETDSASLDTLMLPLARMPEGETFDESFTKTEKDALAELTQSIGIPYFAARRLKPWILAVMLAVPACVHAGKAQGRLGLDDMLNRDAVAAGKRTIGLESIDEQLAVIARLDEVIGPDDLIDLASLDVQEIENWWLTMADLYMQERPALDLFLTRHLPEFREAAEAFRKVESAFIDERNLRMRDRLLPILESGKAFVAVGALHLQGEVGLVELLRQSGYSVTRVPLDG